MMLPAFALAQSSSLGQWSGESPWPTVGVHIAVLADGRIATWGVDTPPAGTSAFNTYIVTIPSGGTDTSAVQKLIVNDDIFCAGETFLPDGRLFVSGGGDQPAPTNGTGRATTDILDPSTNAWNSGPTMNDRRWYPTATTLPSGEILNLLGSIDMNFTPNETPDVTTNGATGIRSLTGVSTATLNYNYPRTFVAPNGKVFIAGMEKTSRYLDITGTGAYTTVASGLFGFRAYGSAVMYDTGKVLIAGGALSDSASTPTNTAEVIDLTAASPAWRNVGPMSFARRYLNATILADGKVLISGGSSGSPAETCTGAVLPAEIWDPTTEQFNTVASMPHVRAYHSSAALLPDGRVISAGTTLGDGTCSDYKDADFYSPPNLFNGPRPSITSAPTSVSYGQQFSVATPDAANISNVNLIALGAATHHFNFSQRINRASFTKGTNTLTVTAPTNSNLSPPGKYMLFILNSAGVPSVAKVVQISNSTTSAVKINAPANGATVSGTVSIVTQVSSAVSWENIYIDGNYFASSLPLTFSWNSTTVTNGTHTISARAFNSSGIQVGSDSVSVTVANGVPTPTPTSTATATATPTPTPSAAVRINAPANGATVSGTVSIVTQVSSAVSWENIYVDGNYFASSPPLTFSWNSTTVTNGAHTISARAFNSSGIQVGSDSVSVTVANGVPTPTPTSTATATATPTPTPSAAVRINAPANGATVSGTVSIVTQVSSAVSWENIYVDGNYFASSPPLTFSWNSTTVTNGAHTISARAFNSSGIQVGSDSVSVTVRN